MRLLLGIHHMQQVCGSVEEMVEALQCEHLSDLLESGRLYEVYLTVNLEERTISRVMPFEFSVDNYFLKLKRLEGVLCKVADEGKPLREWDEFGFAL